MHDLDAKYQEIQAKKQEIINKIKKMTQRLKLVIEKEMNKYPQACKTLTMYLLEQTITAKTQAVKTAKQVMPRIQVQHSIPQIRVSQPRSAAQRTRQIQSVWLHDK